MTPVEVWDECRKIEAEVGPKAQVSAGIYHWRNGVSISIEPQRANAMAEGAPFSIVDTGAGNGAPDDDMAEGA